ncbi:MAG: hypothetical protein ACWGSQ_03020 [Longimicrobiales bacterium]
MSEKQLRIRLLFADDGAFHHESLNVPVSVVEGYDRLIDGLREDPVVLKKVYLDLGRLTAAWVEEE